MKTANQEFASMAEIDSVMAGLSPKEQKRAARKLLKKYDTNIKDLSAQANMKRHEIDCMNAILHWINDNESPVLEKNQCSRFHKLVDAIENGRLITNEGIDKDCPDGGLREIKNTFVVKHDWSAALGVSADEVKLPYDHCVFEFMICGRAIVVPALEIDDIKFSVFVQSGDYWALLGTNHDDGDLRTSDDIVWFVWKQIQAICIALDAEVATSTVMRAPCKLNAKRERSGKRPLADFHVIDLAKQHRVSNPSSGESGHKVRLHFRRGHWRHYEDSKTWIKWCLVGDPDLGFVSKHYSI